MGKLSVLPSQYPTVRRDPAVVEVLHGVTVPDPYRWLEDADAAETGAFVDAQNALTAGVLEQCSTRAQFKQLFQELYDYEKVGLPSRRGARYVYSKNTGLQAQSVVYSAASLGEEGTVLLDPNTLSADGTVALMGSAFSEDGTLLAYSLSSGGSDWRTVRVAAVDQATGERADLPDVLEHVKFSSLAWTHDGRGFFYMSYAPPDTADAGTETGKNSDQQLRYHALGSPQADDPTVLALPEQPDWMMGAEVSDDGRYLILTVSAGCEPVNRLWAVDLAAVPAAPATGALDFSGVDFHRGAAPLPLLKIVDDFSASWDYVGSSEDGGSWTLMTNLGAPRYRVLRVDVSAAAVPPPSQWEVVLEQHGKDLLQWCALLKGGLMACCYLRDVKGALQLRDFASGALVRELPMPGIGSVGGFSGNHKSTEFFFSLTGFTDPGAQYRCDAARPDAEPELFRRAATKFDPAHFTTEQVFVPSADGVLIPMFLVHAKDLHKDGTAPTILYGYGGFSIALEPSFSVSRVAWLLAYGGVLAVANCRGGGEYGVEWRNDGSMGKKQNVFDDFQACAEHLHAAGYCSPATLAIQGGSNGGLLVAACANQRPDLYACVLAQVGVMDMLRFAKFTIGHAWVSDYGDAAVEEHFRWLLPYSPLHNVAPPAGGSRQYPAMLLTTGSHDDRVVPLHTHKLLAQLQHALAGGGDAAAPQRNPLLARVEVRAGHGAGKPTAKIIQETADMFSFAAAVMGAEWRHSTPSE